MTSTATKTSHLERTAAEPRDKACDTLTVTLRRIDQVNPQIRLFRLETPPSGPPVRFLAGQWLDVFVPSVAKAGGFTITSPPSRALPSDAGPGYLELAIQKSPDNPPAAWLWQDSSVVLGQELQVRIGGSFVWPAPGVDAQTLRRVVFVAGGVGINPLVSMLSDISEGASNELEVKFLYSMKDPGGDRDAGSMLFLERLAAIFARQKVKGELKLFLTGGNEEKGTVNCNESDIPFLGRRIENKDVEEAVGGPDERSSAVVYVCGVPTMTDTFVKDLTAKDGFGMAPHTVLCEKWW
ncbi:hypothetical protein JX265_004084 [Neoarthrinium moseri]|uniref:Oxidoreductase NAD-binding domain-containing protein 1 n=1 Tax=Neoarthrinium moseri TaxID=1658444 RepID=A0A9P9WRI7_9PEZI|nr:hypothetical protein JX265_004084 [Neoarthrinium moseri]